MFSLWLMNCANCDEYIGEIKDQIASIAMLVMGDEYIYSYFRCSACEMYTAERYYDRFMGGTDISLMLPFEKEQGEKIIALIRDCPEPNSKFCECDSHQALYTGRIRG